MTFWSFREELSYANRLRRSYYELLRDDLEQVVLDYGLVDSYLNFKLKNIPYPFVERREMKPKARIPALEHECQKVFLVIFVEDTIPSIHKKYIRFFDDNKTTKVNLLKTDAVSLDENFDRTYKYLDSVYFTDTIKRLLPVDFALLIQRDPASRARDRYSVSHFHVKVDWPIADAAEDLGKTLRYISKDLYEKGDKYAEDMQKKFFEFYGLPFMVGGRRSAAIVAAQYLRKIPCISTVFVGSCESRAVMRFSERGVAKSILVKLNREEVNRLAEENSISVTTFRKNYQIDRDGADGVFIFQIHYIHTNHARVPDDGKLREIKPDSYWITVGAEQIMPKPGVWKYPPISVSLVYGKD
ncbi:hypothetical protein [Desulforegula conservatrix]|uniref:hypothetical protein n=1 Tax=Desulforegula conservatrix TaxID=153026 RepID=UPI00040744BC|nr:hypothetical protein [Desulforegula conservatrix]